MEDKRKFNPLVSKAKDDMTPGFLGGKGGGEKPSGLKTGPGNAAAENLSSAEQAAADADLNGNEGGLYNARKNENSAGGGLYRAGIGNDSGRGGMKRGMFRGRFKKSGPITAIILSIFGFGGMMLGVQAFQPFAIVENLRESFNSMHISTERRSTKLLKRMLNSEGVKSPVKGSIFSGSKFKISKKQRTKLAEQGIEVVDDYDVGGKKQTVLIMDDGSGNKTVITADNFEATYRSDSEFRSAYSAGSRTWRGHFANWFGTRTKNFLSKNKLTRALWNNFKEEKEKAGGTLRERIDMMKQKIKEKVVGGTGGGVERVKEEKDENGEPVKDGDGETKKTKVESESESVNTKTKADIEAKINKIKGTITGGVDAYCGVMDFIGTVSLLVVANQIGQILSVTIAYLEAIDKTKAGYGDDAPINEIMATLNESVETEHTVFVDTDNGETVSEGGGSITLKTEAKTKTGEKKTAMQSAGMAALFGNGLVDPNDESVQSFNFTSNLGKIMAGAGLAQSSFSGCLSARIAQDAASATFDAVLMFATGGLGNVLKELASIGVSSLFSLTISAIASAITPWLVPTLSRDLVSDSAGEDLGNVLVHGGNAYQGNVHKTNGGSLASRKAYKRFAVARQQVIAEDAKIERETLSPFDVTSKNTFMGTIMTQLMSFNTTSSLTGMFTTGSSVMSSSLVAMTPTVAATSTQIAEKLPDEDEYEQTCPYLASIGAVGDSFCNPYIITDTDTLNMDPADVVNKIADNFEDEDASDGNVKIKQDSDLMTYIKVCSERTSGFGVYDSTLAQSFASANTGNIVADSIIGAVPIIGDVQDIISNTNIQKNLGYINGESCVADNETSGDATNWETGKYYQRFIEDQSLMESMGVINESAVTTALNEYYEENPLDDSYEGYLARWSGLSKETVSDTLDILSYYEYINEYDPSERYAFGADAVEIEDEDVLLDNEMVLAGDTPLLGRIVYADVRNRSFVV